MSKKRMFEILDEMNQEDTKNNTRLVAVSNTLISGDKVKQGAKIAMGADEQSLQDLWNDKCIPILLLVDKKEYIKKKEEMKEPSFTKEQIKKLIDEFKVSELPNRNEPYHFEAEINAGLNSFIEWIKKK